MRTAREQLSDMADSLYAQAVEKHAEGMALLQESTRISQLSRMLTEDECEQLLNMLLAEQASSDDELGWGVPSKVTRGKA